MRVYALWYGGSNYAAPEIKDREEFRSLRAAKAAFWRRADFDPYYPCVDKEGCTMEVYRTDPAGMADSYPDLIIKLGPRGGVKVSR
jgi:hypothetical protein